MTHKRMKGERWVHLVVTSNKRKRRELQNLLILLMIYISDKIWHTSFFSPKCISTYVFSSSRKITFMGKFRCYGLSHKWVVFETFPFKEIVFYKLI